MTRHHNRQIRRAARPVGLPKPSDFRLVETPIAEPGPGEFLVRALYLSLLQGKNFGKQLVRLASDRS